MIGLEYPAGYGNLVSKLLGETPQKGETRTDWRKRPLTDRQITYALATSTNLLRCTTSCSSDGEVKSLFVVRG